MKKSWTEKLRSSKPYEVKPAPSDFTYIKKGQIMLLPSAQIVDEFIRSIPRGTGMDIKTMRNRLAEKYGAEVSCPIVTGIQLRIVAEAAFEAHEQGATPTAVTPVWRVIDERTPTFRKLTYDPVFILDQREREGL